MPYTWTPTQPDSSSHASSASYADGDPPIATLTLWPHRSLPRKGFAAFILITFVMILVPLLAVLGTMLLWGLLPFLIGTLALTWVMLNRSYHDGELKEVLRIWSDHTDLARTSPGKPSQDWQANPHWIRVEIEREGAVVEYYLTLSGAGRRVELGAFLAPEERVALHQELLEVLARSKSPDTP